MIYIRESRTVHPKREESGAILDLIPGKVENHLNLHIPGGKIVEIQVSSEEMGRVREALELSGAVWP
jgi:hypothetical protein